MNASRVQTVISSRCDTLPLYLASRKRLFWSALLLLHILPFVSTLLQGQVEYSATGAADLLVRIVALFGSLGFFVLKIIDVPWLRLRPGARSWIASTIIVALMHVCAVQRVTEGSSAVSSITIVSVLAAIGLADPSPARRSMSSLLSALRTTATHKASAGSIVWSGWSNVCWSVLNRLLASAIAPRAPPFTTV